MSCPIQPQLKALTYQEEYKLQGSSLSSFYFLSRWLNIIFSTFSSNILNLCLFPSQQVATCHPYIKEHVKLQLCIFYSLRFQTRDGRTKDSGTEYSKHSDNFLIFPFYRQK